jgi:phage protein D
MRITFSLVLVVVLVGICSGQTTRESQKAAYQARKAQVLDARRAAYTAKKESKAKAFAARKELKAKKFTNRQAKAKGLPIPFPACNNSAYDAKCRVYASRAKLA